LAGAEASESDRLSLQIYPPPGGAPAIRVFVGSVLVASTLPTDRAVPIDDDDASEGGAPPLVCRGKLLADQPVVPGAGTGFSRRPPGRLRQDSGGAHGRPAPRLLRPRRGPQPAPRSAAEAGRRPAVPPRPANRSGIIQAAPFSSSPFLPF